MIVQSNSAPVQCFLFVIFSCLAIMLSRISALAWNVFMDSRRLAKTTLIQSVIYLGSL